MFLCANEKIFSRKYCNSLTKVIILKTEELSRGERLMSRKNVHCT
jgi:hypothetical protein